VIAIAGACLAVDRRTRSVRLALGSVAPTVVRASEAEAFAESQVAWDPPGVAAGAEREFGRLAAGAARPIDDHRASAAYRRHAVEVLARRLLRRAFPAFLDSAP
jgi:CO/xanthine dehydrogenase FAD-binding subunit